MNSWWAALNGGNVEHALSMREKLSQMTELERGEAQKKQKTWYDLHARLREFRDGVWSSYCSHRPVKFF